MSDSLAYFQDHLAEATRIRRDIHAHPELGFDEHRTAKVVCEELEKAGIPFESGIAETGIVATLKAGDGNAAIGLRADMDALPIQEQNEIDHISVHAGKMHACGHDGHTVMLLMAAKYLARSRNFSGTVHFIFQPAEEGVGGAQRMIEEGLFQRFPVDWVFGLHNMPGYDPGVLAVREGPMMAGRQSYSITLTGKGGHAAIPQQTHDPIVAAASLVTSLQTIVSRSLAPTDSAVVSVTKLNAGNTHNVIPNTASLGGSIRYFDPKVIHVIKQRMEEIAAGVAATYGCSAQVAFEDSDPPTINDPRAAALAATAMQALGPEDGVDLAPTPMMGAEDFAFMLQAVPGCYAWIGNGPGESGCVLHNPAYDFNDALLVRGPAYWAKLVETVLPA